MKMKKKKLYLRKPRIMILILMMFIFTTGITVVRPEENLSVNVSCEKYTVKENDTMWKISSMYIDQSTDIRKYIARVERLNNIDSQKLIPGMVIYMPIDREK